VLSLHPTAMLKTTSTCQQQHKARTRTMSATATAAIPWERERHGSNRGGAENRQF
ncbi:unnamed protein product, partial [Boreogadus saida]